MTTEEVSIPISALQHYAFCPRQCALIHLEQTWQENSHTVEGMLAHERAHGGECHMRDGVKIVTDLELSSRRLGLCGRSDVVEFHRLDGRWYPYPVEYKKGRPHRGCRADEIQLCGQALCLEEMLGITLDEGALFYGAAHRRSVISFTPELRRLTEETTASVHALFRCGITPPPVETPACGACSLQDACMPGLAKCRASAYVEDLCRTDAGCEDGENGIP